MGSQMHTCKTETENNKIVTENEEMKKSLSNNCDEGDNKRAETWLQKQIPPRFSNILEA